MTEPEYFYAPGKGWLACVSSVWKTITTLSGQRLRLEIRKPNKGEQYAWVMSDSSWLTNGEPNEYFVHYFKADGYSKARFFNEELGEGVYVVAIPED